MSTEAPKSREAIRADIMAAVDKFLEAEPKCASVAEAARQAGLPIDKSASSWLASFIDRKRTGAYRIPDHVRNERIRVLFLEKGMNYSEIGHICRPNLTRERVRQILVSLGVDTDAEFHQRNLAATKQLPKVRNCAVVETKQRLAKLHRKRFAEWRRLWAEGKSLKEMAAHFGMKPADVHQRIHRLRYSYGWFPYRYCAEHRTAVAQGMEKARIEAESE